jgi:DNA-binding CsgD family transcriptional regulator
MTDYEVMRIRNGLRGTGGYFNRCYEIAKNAFLSGNSIDAAIQKAKSKYGF